VVCAVVDGAVGCPVGVGPVAASAGVASVTHGVAAYAAVRRSVELVSAGVVVAAVGMPRFGAAGDHDGAPAVLLEGEKALDHEPPDAFQRSALRPVAISAAAAGDHFDPCRVQYLLRLAVRQPAGARRHRGPGMSEPVDPACPVLAG
jgi:hypothetical protein